MSRRGTGTAWSLGGLGAFAFALCGLLAGAGSTAGNAAMGAQEEHVYYPGKWQFVADLLATSNRANELATLWAAGALAIAAALLLDARYGGGVRRKYALGAVAVFLVCSLIGFFAGGALDTQLYPFL